MNGPTDVPPLEDYASLAERLAYAEGWHEGLHRGRLQRMTISLLLFLAGFGFGIAFHIVTKGNCP